MRLIDIIKKDLRIVLRDRAALMFIFLMPIVLIVILSFALGHMFEPDGVSIGKVHIAVVDQTTQQETQDVSRQMAAYGAAVDLREMSLYSVLDSNEVAEFLSYEMMDEAAAASKLQAGEIDAVVTIPKGFTAGLLNAMSGMGEGVQIHVTGGRGRNIEASVVNGIVSAYADTFSSLSHDMGILIQTVMKSGAAIEQTMKKLDIPSYMQSLATAPGLQVNLEGVAARKALNSFSYYTIAITCMFVLYTAGQGSGLLLAESQEKTLLRLAAAGIPTKKLLLGKSFAVFFLCIVQLFVLLGISTLAFRIDWGNPLVFAAISLCVAVAVTGLGVLLMVLTYRTGNANVGSAFQSVIVQVLALFGGSFLPLSVLPRFFSAIAPFTPNGLALLAYTGNQTGAPLTEILPYMLGSLGLGLVLYLLGWALFPKVRRAS